MMCGIFGAIGPGFNPGIIRALALINRERGMDSLGFVCGEYRTWKEAGDPLDLLSSEACNQFAQCWDKTWFVIGHTRHATRGGITDANAHPFRSGRWIGVHNGIIAAPREYAVDSMYLWDQLEQNKGDYQAAWLDIAGTWGLAWYDGRHVYLQAHQQELAITTIGAVTYFSSDWCHLAAATGCNDVQTFASGETWRFLKNGSAVKQKKFVSKVKAWTTLAKGMSQSQSGYPYAGRDVYPEWDAMLDFAYVNGIDDQDTETIAEEYESHMRSMKAEWDAYAGEQDVT